MEYSRGRDAGRGLAQGPLPLAQALDYAGRSRRRWTTRIAPASSIAISNPANVMLTKGGAKLLDFGLAKPRASRRAVRALTLRLELTGPGTILGTAQYMAPEQVEGKDGGRANRSVRIWRGAARDADGQGKHSTRRPTRACGRHPVDRSRRASVELEPGLPPFLDYVVGRCLAKDPDERWQTARDLLAELERSRASLRPSGGPSLPGGFHVAPDTSRASRAARRVAMRASAQRPLR